MWTVAAAAVGGVIWLDPLNLSKPKPKVGVIADAAVSTPVPVRIEPADAAIAEPVVSPLYTVTEAFEDVASGPLVFIGTGEWFGNYSIKGCAYHNDRVIVVNQYCTVKEQPAFGFIVISPTRGHVDIYVEADSAISTIYRATYATFRVESEPVVPGDPIAVDVAYADLRAWDERRYNAHVPGCWSGDTDGCARGAEPRLAAWLPSTKEFLTAPPQAFYDLVKDMHARAVRDSRRPK